MAEGRKGFLADRSINRVWERLGGSFHSKATGLLNGREQLLIELLVALVSGNVDPVEAGGKHRHVSALQHPCHQQCHHTTITNTTITSFVTPHSAANDASKAGGGHAAPSNKSHLQYSHLDCSLKDSFDYVIGTALIIS